MVKIQPLEAPEQNYSIEYLYYNDYLDVNLEKFQSKELSKSIFEEFFSGDWRKGQEISKIVITKRFYQISSSSTQAWFSNIDFTIKRPKMHFFYLSIFEIEKFLDKSLNFYVVKHLNRYGYNWWADFRFCSYTPPIHRPVLLWYYRKLKNLFSNYVNR